MEGLEGRAEFYLQKRCALWPEERAQWCVSRRATGLRGWQGQAAGEGQSGRVRQERWAEPHGASPECHLKEDTLSLDGEKCSFFSVLGSEWHNEIRPGFSMLSGCAWWGRKPCGGGCSCLPTSERETLEPSALRSAKLPCEGPSWIPVSAPRSTPWTALCTWYVPSLGLGVPSEMNALDQVPARLPSRMGLSNPGLQGTSRRCNRGGAEEIQGKAGIVGN